MTEAVIVSTARTPIGKAYRGRLNLTTGPAMAAHAIQGALHRAGVEPEAIEEVVMGCGHPEGTTGGNVARMAAVMAGVPVQATGVTVSRFCGSGLEAVSAAAKRILLDKVPVAIAGGVESVSLVQPHLRRELVRDPWHVEHMPDIFMSMIETADIVAHRYGISREDQDAFALQSQQRTARAQAEGLFDNEILPMNLTWEVTDKATGEKSLQSGRLDRDEGNRPETTLDALLSLKPVRGEGEFVTAGNASQLSDGASALVIMSDTEARARHLKPLGAFRGFATGGCAPDEMGIGPVFAVPRLLERHGLTVDDIDLWELNEAFASQALYVVRKLGIDQAKLNVNGGGISIGHPFGMTGARLAGHILLEGQRRLARGERARYAVVTMCIAGGMGAAGLFEIFDGN